MDQGGIPIYLHYLTADHHVDKVGRVTFDIEAESNAKYQGLIPKESQLL